MKYFKKSLILFLSSMVSLNVLAQGSEHAIAAGVFSAFLGGFFILFLAVFFFTFGVKTIINYKKQKWTPKSILTSSLMIGFVTSLVSSVLLYIILNFL
jgi:hypothetical protein